MRQRGHIYKNDAKRGCAQSLELVFFRSFVYINTYAIYKMNGATYLYK